MFNFVGALKTMRTNSNASQDMSGWKGVPEIVKTDIEMVPKWRPNHPNSVNKILYKQMGEKYSKPVGQFIALDVSVQA